VWNGSTWNLVTTLVEGHKIYDSSGTLMTQQSKLKFTRLNVTNDGGNAQTIVTRPADTFVGTTAPASPVEGDVWRNSETWKTYTWYDSFWVEQNINSQGGSGDLSLNAVFDGMGATVLVGSKSYFRMASSGTIKGWSIIATGTSPTCTLDVWKVATGTSLPTVANTIMGTKPQLTTGNALYSITMTGWTTTYAAKDIFCVNVDACANATYIQFLLYT
jgi:hypothetical protein